MPKRGLLTILSKMSAPCGFVYFYQDNITTPHGLWRGKPVYHLDRLGCTHVPHVPMLGFYQRTCLAKADVPEEGEVVFHHFVHGLLPQLGVPDQNTALETVLSNGNHTNEIV